MDFVITAGGTREYIDPVRFISNASSGRCGYALARAAVKAGHGVTLITAPSCLRPPGGAKVVAVETGREMFAAVKNLFKNCDCLIMAAAVTDYAPASRARTKIKKADRRLTIELRPTPDILKWVGRHKKKGQVVVGFALEDRKLRANAERKLQEKNLDMIVANTPAAIGCDEVCVHIKTLCGEWLRFGPTSKTRMAEKVISLSENILRAGRGA